MDALVLAGKNTPALHAAAAHTLTRALCDLRAN